jgi:hypothetical protein
MLPVVEDTFVGTASGCAHGRPSGEPAARWPGRTGRVAQVRSRRSLGGASDFPTAADAGLTFAVQVGTDGLAVSVQMPGGRRDRPALLAERMRFHISLRCHHGAGSS